MEYQYHYNGKVERKEKITEAEGLGYRMLHDNFDDPNWKRGNPMVGTLIFTDEPEPVAPENPDVTTLQAYLADPHSGLPDLETAFQALTRLYLGES